MMEGQIAVLKIRLSGFFGLQKDSDIQSLVQAGQVFKRKKEPVLMQNWAWDWSLN